MINRNRRWLLVLSALAIISLIVIYLSVFFETPPHTTGFSPGYRPVPIHSIFLSPLFLIIAIIPLSYYFIARKFEEKMESNLKAIFKLMNKNNIKTKSFIQINKDAILRFLNLNERKVLEKLIDKNGETMQSEITRMEGMSKLKTHRAIKNLEIKGVIRAERHGKTKRIILSKDIKNMLINSQG